MSTNNDNNPPPEEDDLDAALDALDFDTDFLASTTFDASDDHGTSELEIAPFKDNDDDDKDKAAQPSTVAVVTRNAAVFNDWKDRPEIYSRHFKPAPQERAALEEIANLLGVKSGLPKPAGGGGGGVGNFMDTLLGGNNSAHQVTEMDDDETVNNNNINDPQSQWNRLVSGKNTPHTQKLPISIILQQGTVMYKDVDVNAENEPVTHHGCDLILLTRGFFLVKRETVSAGLFGTQKKDRLQLLGSAPWTQVCQIHTNHLKHPAIVLTCGAAHAKPQDQVHFILLPAHNFDDWLTALQTAATQAHLHFLSDDCVRERGWQYRLCHTPWFTEAVTGEWEDVGLEFSTSESAEKGLDQLDSLNGYAPLHYATRANHVDVMRRLLQAGANPNVQDKEGKTPMYYAQRDELPIRTVQLLEEFGAVQSQKAQEEMRGELFGKVAETEKAREYKRQEQEAAAKAAQEKAESAQSQMAQNMAAMHKRGEMIEELGDKATELQDGAQDYADMAALLKEKMKKKSVWGF